ncbi:ATP-binding cassette domain-containing protein [Lichenihabitans sp. PAMC28606]|uniref:ATP-binding cassette domain-containing protein n=1 Tax=Lichenihabitans sp. PAMC28606 TaxID=2880932 RepID=UPI001D0A1ABF|nr:ATP-binding cassette domain-containing protein [Lichenihabitans sp. PAMC28606]UDL95646.1 ATP-binding cassette domain-containing protein [Lichenihabitans sp. PAMC28606]
MNGPVDPAIAITGLTKSYGRVKALQDVSFTVEPGTVTALLGLNGAGKTTLFQILTGLFVADAGHVLVRGFDIARDPTAALARMGIVFQQTVLDLDLTVAQNLRFYAGLHGLRGARAEAAARHALGVLGCGDLGPSTIRQLSGGTRRKIEIARALLTSPDVLLLDEPSGGLDTGSRADLARTLFGLAAERGTAVLWATHLVQEIERAGAVVVLHRGRVAASGSPAALMAEAGAATLEAAFLTLAGTGAEPAA